MPTASPSASITLTSLNLISSLIIISFALIPNTPPMVAPQRAKKSCEVKLSARQTTLSAQYASTSKVISYRAQPLGTVRTERSSSFCSTILPHFSPFVKSFFKIFLFFPSALVYLFINGHWNLSNTAAASHHPTMQHAIYCNRSLTRKAMFWTSSIFFLFNDIYSSLLWHSLRILLRYDVKPPKKRVILEKFSIP